MESTPSSSPARHWRLYIPVSLGVILLLASLVIAAVSLRSHAGDGSSVPPAATASSPADEHRWMSLGYVDIEGGVTPLYPLQQGRVKSVLAKENKPVKKGDPLFELEDTVPALKVRQAEDDLNAAKERLALAEAKVKQLDEQIAAQQAAVDAAQIDVQRAGLKHDKMKRFQQNGVEGDTESVKDAELLVKKAKEGVHGEERKLAALQAGREQAAGAVKLANIDIKAKEAQLNEAQNAVNECVVRAPADGTPLRILVSVGQALGANPRQPAVQFAADRPLLVRAEVEQEFVGHVREGESVLIQDHVTGQDCARGKVVSIARWYSPRRTASPELFGVSNDVRTLECIVQIESTSQEVRIGQRVRVQFPD
jgi:multidrug resistance efflux pump